MGGWIVTWYDPDKGTGKRYEWFGTEAEAEAWFADQSKQYPIVSMYRAQLIKRHFEE